MIELGHGHVHLEKGEDVPLVCPRCRALIPFCDKLVVIKCRECQYLGVLAEFSATRFKPV